MITPLMYIFIFGLSEAEQEDKVEKINNYLLKNCAVFFEENNINTGNWDFFFKERKLEFNKANLFYHVLSIDFVTSSLDREIINFMKELGDNLIKLDLVQSYILRDFVGESTVIEDNSFLKDKNNFISDSNNIRVGRNGIIVGKTSNVVITLFIRFFSELKYDYELGKLIPKLLSNTSKQPIKVVVEYEHQSFIEEFYADPLFIKYRSDKKVKPNWISRLFSKNVRL